MKRPNLYDRLKVVAVLTMIIDHVWYIFLPEISWLRLIGRIAFPIFLFLVGFNGNYKRRRDLFAWAIVVQIPIFVLAWYFYFWLHTFNILFGIILARMFLGWLSTLVNKPPTSQARSPLLIRRDTIIVVVTIVLLIINPWLANILDYGSFVILLPLMWFLFKKYYSHRIGNLLYSVLIFTCLFVFTQTIFDFSFLQLILLSGFFVILLCIFFILWQANRFLPLGKKNNSAVVFISKNALLIYVFHLLVLWIIKMILLLIWWA